MLITRDDAIYLEAPFENEPEIENIVQKYADRLFGSNIIYLPKLMVLTIGGTATIPDGFVIDIERAEWSMIEVERASHGTWTHIARQVSRHIAAAKTPE